MAGLVGRRFGALAALTVIAVACSSSNDNTGGTDAGAGAGTCGNGIVEGAEECDGTAQITCGVGTMNARPNGVVGCTACRFDFSNCSSSATGTGGSINGGSGSTGVSTGGSGPDGSGGTVVATGGGPGIGGDTSSGGATASGGTTSSGGVTSSGGTPSTGGTTSSGVLGDVNALRQACVDTINQYRSTLGASALSRAPAATETCSDTGAQQDAAAGVAHGSAGNCPGMSAQDTCPGWGTAQYGGAEGAMKQCLAQMWAEGEPPEGRDKCISDYFAGNTACFLAHGHYLNMSNPQNGVVSCGFYVMSNGKVWMNQDFGR